MSVGVSLYVLSVGEISYKFMDFTFDMYFRQFWIDERLKFDNGKVRVEGCQSVVTKVVLLRVEWRSWWWGLTTSN